MAEAPRRTPQPVPRGTDVRLFAALHRRHVDTDRAPPPWDALRVDGLDETTRSSLGAAWAARTVAEYRSMVVFGELLARMPEAAMPLEVSCAAARLISDEARHTEYCARLAEALGARADEATVDPLDLRLDDGSLSAPLFVARWTMGMFCVGEAASVGLLQALAREARDPCVSAVLATLLRDEALHDRFGWALAESIVPRLSDDEREWLGADLALILAHYDRTNGRGMRPDGGSLPDDAPDDDHYAGATHGIVAPTRFARAWYDRLDRVILPGLDALGIAAYEAWALRHEAAALSAQSAQNTAAQP